MLGVTASSKVVVFNTVHVVGYSSHVETLCDSVEWHGMPCMQNPTAHLLRWCPLQLYHGHHLVNARHCPFRVAVPKFCCERSGDQNVKCTLVIPPEMTAKCKRPLMSSALTWSVRWLQKLLSTRAFQCNMPTGWLSQTVLIQSGTSLLLIQPFSCPCMMIPYRKPSFGNIFEGSSLPSVVMHSITVHHCRSALIVCMETLLTPLGSIKPDQDLVLIPDQQRVILVLPSHWVYEVVKPQYLPFVLR